MNHEPYTLEHRPACCKPHCSLTEQTPRAGGGDERKHCEPEAPGAERHVPGVRDGEDHHHRRREGGEMAE